MQTPTTSKCLQYINSFSGGYYNTLLYTILHYIIISVLQYSISLLYNYKVLVSSVCGLSICPLFINNQGLDGVLFQKYSEAQFASSVEFKDDSIYCL